MTATARLDLRLSTKDENGLTAPLRWPDYRWPRSCDRGIA